MELTKFGASESKEYYEAEMQRKILYIPNLSNILNLLNMQILKLPHELLDPSNNAPTGQTYEDIIQSFCNGVDVVMANLSPKLKRMKFKYTPPEDQPDRLKSALHKLAWIYDMLDEMDALNDNIVQMDMDEDEAYDDDDGNMPALD